MTAPTIARPNRRGMLTGSDMRSCCTLNREAAMVIECGSGIEPPGLTTSLAIAQLVLRTLDACKQR